MPADLIIVIDSREPGVSHPWESYFTRETVRTALPTGDFSLPGCADWIAIERKTLDDLVQCLCSSRERFIRELQRAARIKDFVVIVESHYSDVLRGNFRSAMTPKSAWESIVAFQMRFGIPFLFAGSAEIGATLCESILRRCFLEHNKVVDEARKAQKRFQCNTGETL